MRPTPTRTALRLTLALSLVAGVVGFGAAALADDHPANAPPPIGFDLLPALSPGDTGDAVAALQRRLAEAKLYQGEFDGEYGAETAAAVEALHKLLDVERTSTFRSDDWLALADLPAPRIPRRGHEPDRVEVDIGRQLIYLIKNRELIAILPTSTGGAYTYWSERQGAHVRAGTPRGDFTLFRFDPGWRCDPVTGWCVYNYWAFTTYYGLHGYLSVPTYPASHGCVRLHTWNSDWMSEQLYLGMPVHVWDDPPPPISVAEGPLARVD